MQFPQPSGHLIPRQGRLRTGSKIGPAPLNFGKLPGVDGHVFRPARDIIPEIFDQLEFFGGGEAEDRACIGFHGNYSAFVVIAYQAPAFVVAEVLEDSPAIRTSATIFSPPELVIRRKHPVVAMPVLPRRRDEIGEPVQELNRRELDDAIGSRPRGLSAAARPDPGGGFVPRERVADADDAAVGVADHGEPFKREGRPGTVSEQVLKRLTLDTHLGR